MTLHALITGGNGFVAQWAIRAMLERGWTVTAAGIGDFPDMAVITDAERRSVQWHAMDVTQQKQVEDVVNASCPDVVLHLAAISHVPDAMGNPGRTYDVNAVGTVRLLSQIARLRIAQNVDPMILIVGSAEQYGRHDADRMPLTEETEQRPLTLYAASKTAQEVASMQLWRSEGLRVICTRSFNHSGVGQAPRFLLPGLVSRARALRDSGGDLLIGNGAIVRDFLHVSDVVAAYLALLERGTPGEAYNVSSGQGCSVRELAASVLEQVGVCAEIVSDPGRTRTVDVPILVGNNEKLRRATDWAPLRSRSDIIEDLINAASR